MMPEYEKYSIEELYDIYEDIDSNAYPERFEVVSQLLEKHNKNTTESEIVDFKNARFKSIHARLAIDNAVFTFGNIELDSEERFGYRIFCAGEGADSVECYMPLTGKGLRTFISSLNNLDASGFKRKLKIQTTEWADINFQFDGSSDKKGIKIRTYLSGTLLCSSGFFSSYIKQSKLDSLTENLKLCI